MEVSGALVQHIDRGNGICSSSSSLGCAVLGDIWISEALKPYGDLAVPDVVNSKVDSITDDPKFKKHVRKKKKRNKKRTYSSKKISNKIVSMAGERCPLAEFERFLHSAAPAIASLYQHGKCSLCLGDQLSDSSLCKHQIPNTSLFSVWNWYKEPGNYGLKVKVGDSQKLKGRLTESASFDAHFVPYLSAVQLFGYSYLSNSCGHSQSFTPSPDRSSNCELLFEFFETEKPWLQRPLHNNLCTSRGDKPILWLPLVQFGEFFVAVSKSLYANATNEPSSTDLLVFIVFSLFLKYIKARRPNIATNATEPTTAPMTIPLLLLELENSEAASLT
ncbi:hypothetical protein CUMW_138300, partial [Citrus unshiu]